MKGRAIVVVDRGKVEIRAIEPRPVGEWDIKVELEHSAISAGTESYVLSQPGGDREVIPGYAPVGRVVEAGAEAAALFSVGDVVSYFSPDAPVGGPAMSCGGHQSPAVLNVDPRKRDLRGPDQFCLKVPAELSTDHAAFGGIAAVSSMGATMPDPKPGDRALVVGQGVIGLFATQHLRLLGAEVAVADTLPGRLEIAARCGADHLIDAEDADTAQALRDIWPEGADIVVDSTGSCRVIEAAVPAVRRRGKFVFLGWCKGKLAIENFHHQRVFQAYFPWTLEGERVLHSWRMILQGGIRVEPVITHRMKVEDAQRAYDMIRERPGECLGVVLDWRQQ